MESLALQSCIEDYQKNPEIKTEEKLSKSALERMVVNHQWLNLEKEMDEKFRYSSASN
jgi:hypothetical protein